MIECATVLCSKAEVVFISYSNIKENRIHYITSIRKIKLYKVY